MFEKMYLNTCRKLKLFWQFKIIFFSSGIKFLYVLMFTIVLIHHRPTPPLSHPTKQLMAIRIVLRFSHLWPGVFHIPLPTHKIRNSEGGIKRRINRLGLALSARKEKFVTL